MMAEQSFLPVPTCPAGSGPSLLSPGPIQPHCPPLPPLWPGPTQAKGFSAACRPRC